MSVSYMSDLRPDFKPFEIDCGKIRAYRYDGNLRTELITSSLNQQTAVGLYEDMLMVREMEEMIVKVRSGAYEPIKGFDYRGPTHVSIGQEAASVGACSALLLKDYITSTHRGHGDSLARGCLAIRCMDETQLRKRVPDSKAASRQELLEEVLEDHVYRTLAELFGKDDGYCKGRGGGMHIADFTVGHLGANAIVGGGVPIATGAAVGSRYLRNGTVVCCFAGDGSYANGSCSNR
jgi:2-oxoisovalerate dehydrogenase E1 component